MEDINTLTGIEFENLCQVLLQKAGFDVETTKTSGDGGIDLIARNQQPFFSGKYIIQCKRYTGSVGEPVVRDLYGVVTAERANKGILLTTGHFTASAIRFAEDKNLELIDGEELKQILSKYDLGNSSKPIQYDYFTEHACFNKQKYEFYKNKKDKNQCSAEMAHDFLFDFMFGYIRIAGKNKKINSMLCAGFADEYKKLFDWYLGKYLKPGKYGSSIQEKYVRNYKGLAQLLNFDLYDYVQERYAFLTKPCRMEIKFSTKCAVGEKTLKALRDGEEESWAIMKSLIEDGKGKLTFKKQSEQFYELMNLLAIFKYFGIESGITVVHKILHGGRAHIKELLEMQKDYQNAIKSAKILYFIDECWYELAGSVNLSSYYKQNMVLHSEKIQSEISQIEDLIVALF